MALFGSKDKPPFKWPQELVPNEQTTFVKDVSKHQGNLKLAGKKRQPYALVPEPSNPEYDDAVMVCAILRDGLYHVGYLRSGEFKTEHFKELGLRLEQEKTLLVAMGYTEPYVTDAGLKMLGLRLEIPRWQWLKARLGK